MQLPGNKPRQASFSLTSQLYMLLTACFLLISAPSSRAQDAGLNILTVGPGSESLGLNEAVTAELLGASNLYSNPANLAMEQSSTLNADYTLWVGGLTHTHAAVNLKKKKRAVAFGFLGSGADNLQLRKNRAGPAEGTFNISFLSLSGGYAYKLGPIALGAAVQYIREEYYIYNASGYAANFGASTELWNKRIRIGSSLLNLGEMSKLRNTATNLPTTFRAGFDAAIFRFTPPENKDLLITVNLKNDWVYPIHAVKNTTQSPSALDPYTNIALEFDIAETIQLRTGYKSGDTVRHWSAGAGINVESISANYALIPFDTGFGTVHSLGISYRF